MKKLNLQRLAECHGKRLKVYTVGNYEVRKIVCDSGYTTINVERTNHDHFTPEIYPRNSWETDELEGFEVQTTSYGSLPIDELQKVIEGLQEAKEVAELLTSVFLNK